MEMTLLFPSFKCNIVLFAMLKNYGGVRGQQVGNFYYLVDNMTAASGIIFCNRIAMRRSFFRLSGFLLEYLLDSCSWIVPNLKASSFVFGRSDDGLCDA